MGRKHRQSIPPGEEMATPPRAMGYNAAQRVTEAEPALNTANRALRQAMEEVSHNNGLSSLVGKAFGEVNAALTALERAEKGK